jgi:hypothetical protein
MHAGSQLTLARIAGHSAPAHIVRLINWLNGVG